MVSYWRIAASLLCCTLLLSCATIPSKADDEEHFLDYSEDNFKVAFMSDNLTAAVTHDWPRIVFHHSTDPFSPTFEVGFSRLYLYNDTNSDNEFTLSEIEYVSHLDENHVAWNVTPVEFANDTVSGEYARFRMNATLNLYLGSDDQIVAIPEWANITFWFRICEKNVTCTNSLGSYVVKGKTDLLFNYTLDIIKSTNLTGIAFEQLIQGGGVAYMFLLKQKGSHTDVVDRMVSSRFDERIYGTNFTNDFVSTALPEQAICFAKEEGTVMAYYRWDSVPNMSSGGSMANTSVNNAFLTTGTGMLLHSSYSISNETTMLYQEASIGIEESAFTGKITDWLRDNAVGIALFLGAVVAIVAAVVIVLRYRRSTKAPEDAKGDCQEKNGPRES